MGITFHSEGHKYTNELGKYYTSVTTIIGKYKEAFDKKYWSEYKAIERIIIENSSAEYFKEFKANVGYKNVIKSFYATARKDSKKLVIPYQKLVLKDWDFERDIACFNGSNFHEAKEQGWLSKPKHYEGVVRKEWYTTGVQNTKGENISPEELPDGVYSELVLWNNYYEIAGQADIVFIETIDGVRYIDIDDYKTNKKIEEKSYYHPRRGNKMMKNPVKTVMDCNHGHYELQISTYAFLLEKFGFKVRNLNFQHWKNVAKTKDGEKDKENPRYELAKDYTLKYLGKEVKDMLTHYKNSKK